MSPTGYPDYPTSLTIAPQFTVLKPPITKTDGKYSFSTELMNKKRLPSTMRRGLHPSWLILILLVSCSLSGCLGDSEDAGAKNPISMEVYYDATSGTIEEVIQNGAVLSQSGVELSFDFARVASNAGNMNPSVMTLGMTMTGLIPSWLMQTTRLKFPTPTKPTECLPQF